MTRGVDPQSRTVMPDTRPGLNAAATRDCRRLEPTAAGEDRAGGAVGAEIVDAVDGK